MFKVSPYTINKFYQKYQDIKNTARALEISEEEVKNGLAKLDEIRRRNAKKEERRAQWRREPDSLPNALLSTIAVLGFIFFPITLAISFVFSPPKHKKRKF